MWHPIQPVQIKHASILNFYPSLGKITWIEQEFLSHNKIQDFLSGMQE